VSITTVTFNTFKTSLDIQVARQNAESQRYIGISYGTESQKVFFQAELFS